MDLTFQVPLQYCSLQHRTSITSHIHNWALFLLWLCVFILSGVISPLFFSSILGIYQPGEFIFQCHIFLPFPTVHGTLKERILTWFAIPFSRGPHINIYVYRSTIYNSQNEKRVKIPINKWMGKLNLVYTKEYQLFSHKKIRKYWHLLWHERTLKTLCKWKKSDTKRQRLCGFIYMRYPG